ncbi:Regulator of nucleoside diphosphate kinase [Magnetospirillum sp. XM-1]|uniref:nucleoside diphosphate kinase regulator n=1 Tax=Magnetospirillum sp. XM-1 TaxID=1663591 RepID=UPI00073DFCB4|nr:nucleoside diphosphate kinase regulator [Magnetospirillum sp. XM-1]CUW39613.1 Regulator of nucleoside diphosphate kinase [Magnetospirillum sp. XM-1]
MRSDASLPPIIVSREDAERLWALCGLLWETVPKIAAFLEEELDRADTVACADLAADIVRMGSSVRFRDEATGIPAQATLVYPGQEDADRHLVSVLSPVGAALLGLRPGQSINFKLANGRMRRLTVLAVKNPPENGRVFRAA